MLSIISIAILLFGMILFGSMAILIIIGGNMNKSEEERRLEDEEQMRYIREYNEKHKKNKSL